MKYLNISIVILTLTMLQSCLPFTQFESARTLEKEQIKGTSSISALTLFENGAGDDFQDVTLPYFDAGIKYGLNGKMDIGVNINSLGFIYLDTKYQFIGDKTSSDAVSIGFGIDINPFFSTLDALNGGYFKLHLPFYYSHHFNKNKNYLFINPKIAYQKVIEGNEDFLFGGVSTGIGFQLKKIELLAGIGIFGGQDLNGNDGFSLTIVQPGIGIRYNMRN